MNENVEFLSNLSIEQFGNTSIESLLLQVDSHTLLQDGWEDTVINFKNVYDENGNVIYTIFKLSEEVYISCLPMKLEDILLKINSGKITISFAYSESFGLIFTNFYLNISEDECPKTSYVYKSSSGAVYSVIDEDYFPPNGPAPYQILSRYISTKITKKWTNPKGNEEQFLKLLKATNFDDALFPVRLKII